MFGWLRRRRARPAGAGGGATREEARAVREHLQGFARSRAGVEVYVEPPTAFTPTTVVLVATSGEWTRRRVPDATTVRWLSQDLCLPVYDVQLTGYPRRMREYTARRRQAERGGPAAGPGLAGSGPHGT